MHHFLPNKKLELLTIPFYILSFVAIAILTQNIKDIYLKTYTTSIFTSPVIILEILIGVIFLIFSVVLYFYLNFFTESFPSCIAMQNNKPLEGIYKYIRHPSYYTFLFICFGTALCLQSPIIFILAIINHVSLYFYYLIEERQIAKTNNYYKDYLKKTKRFFPVFPKKTC